ncbi:MAG: alpha-1,4-glucan--maltose-1-phosphate maltosyltransferase [Candidatus Omnitrophica bacterium]|nr:alpha-1,4-glucan--maltose-1-phosphate maltosyltransferase [Candidatus Omnitrophota bacterium]
MQKLNRVIIEVVQPQVDGGAFPIRRVIGEKVAVKAHIFADGPDCLGANLLYGTSKEKKWQKISMQFLHNDEWVSSFKIENQEPYRYTVEAWLDRFATWRRDLQKKYEAGQDILVDLQIGVQILKDALKGSTGVNGKKIKEYVGILESSQPVRQRLEIASRDELSELMSSSIDPHEVVVYEKELKVEVDSSKALFSSWYEIFPRSCSQAKDSHGTLKDCISLLPAIAKMNFDVLYLPPVHPIGTTNRKGRNNALIAMPLDPGSPWAIGSSKGGHTAIHPELGSLADLKLLVKKGRELGIDVAMDLAFQCSPDHPYVKAHPEWFKWRPDGAVQFAENPPKKYEDIIPFDFEGKDQSSLWEELKNIVCFWISQGVCIFRVDNPHTKPFAFWAWLISEVRKEHEGIIFLAEAFTRPKAMYRLAKIGFNQSYTYFTWRNTKQELIEYLTELTTTEVAEFFRPNFWPNTPDILSEYLQYGGKPAFLARLVLAATLSSNYGIYGPAYELCVNEALPGKEEYNNSEKYQIQYWERNRPGTIKDFVARLNKVRRENLALQMTRNIRFCPIENNHLIAYAKTSDDLSNIIITVVNLDPFHTQSGWLQLPLQEFGIDTRHPYLAHDLLSNDKYIWHGPSNYIELNPQGSPAHILRLHRRLRREQDFDYYM